MRLRTSIADDIHDLYAVWQRSVAATHDFVDPADLAEIDLLVRDQYLPKETFTVAVDDEDVILAFMGMSDNVIDSLFVDASARGRGVGRLLMAEARRLHPDGLAVDVNEQNSQAVGFYTSLDFRVNGRSPVDHQGRPYPILHLAWTPEAPQ